MSGMITLPLSRCVTLPVTYSNPYRIPALEKEAGAWARVGRSALGGIGKIMQNGGRPLFGGLRGQAAALGATALGGGLLHHSLSHTPQQLNAEWQHPGNTRLGQEAGAAGDYLKDSWGKPLMSAIGDTGTAVKDLFGRYIGNPVNRNVEAISQMGSQAADEAGQTAGRWGGQLSGAWHSLTDPVAESFREATAPVRAGIGHAQVMGNQIRNNVAGTWNRFADQVGDGADAAGNAIAAPFHAMANSDEAQAYQRARHARGL